MPSTPLRRPAASSSRSRREVARPNHRVLDCFSQVISGIDQLQRQLSAIHTGVTGAANRLEGSGRTSEVLGPVHLFPADLRGQACWANCPSGRAARRQGSGSMKMALNTTSSVARTTGSRPAMCWQNSESVLLVAPCGWRPTSRSSSLRLSVDWLRSTLRSPSTTNPATKADGRATAFCRESSNQVKP